MDFFAHMPHDDNLGDKAVWLSDFIQQHLSFPSGHISDMVFITIYYIYLSYIQ